MSTTIYLVRHAKKEKGIGDVPLTFEGVKQAQMTASHFCSMSITKLLCSPLARAKQTAECIGEGIILPVIEDIRLRERANWGDLPGQSFEEFAAMWDHCTKDRDFIPAIGDSAKIAGERLSSFLVEMSIEFPQDPIIAVTHGGLITDFLVHVCSQIELNQWHPHFLKEQSKLVPECSITKLICRDGTFQLVDFANVSHLE